MKTKDFVRIRVGCAPTTEEGVMKKPKGEDAVVRYLMSNLGTKEKEMYGALVAKVEEALTLLQSKGRSVAMNVVNTG
jgi:peptidyl-tRNA hydrolase